MNKTRFFLLLLVALAALALVGVAMAADNPPPESNISTGVNSNLNNAPEALWPGPDGFGYVGQIVPYSWVDISGSGTPITGLGDDNFVGPFNIGFTFPFYGTNYTQFYAGSNGFISFGAGSTSLSNQCPLPNATAPNNLIAMVWDDMNFGSGGQAFYQTFSTCPVGPATQCLVVEYLNLPYYSGGGTATVEVILYPNNQYRIQVMSLGQGGSSSTTGGEGNNATADHGLTFACNTPNSVPPNTAIHFAIPLFYITPEYQEIIGCNCEVQNHTLTARNNDTIPVTVVFTYTLEGNGDFGGPSSLVIPANSSAIVPIELRLSACNLAGEAITLTVDAGVIENGMTDSAVIYKESAGQALIYWGAIATEPDNGRMDNVVAEYNGYAWSITGYGANNQVRYYNPATNVWTSLTPTGAVPPNNYARSGCAPTNGPAYGKVFVYGDTTGSFTGLRSYDMATNTWTALTPGGTPPTTTGIWAPAWVYNPYNGLCYMTGGATTPGTGNLNTVYVYDPANNAWLAPLPNFTTVRDFHAAFIYERPSDFHHLLCVVGGNSANVGISSTQCYDFNNGAWNPENADIPPLPASAGWWGMGYSDKWHLGYLHQLWVLGGVDGASALSAAAYYFDVQSGAWIDGGPYGATPTYRTSAITVNNEIYKLGGSVGGFTYTGLAWRHYQLVCSSCNPWSDGVKIAPPTATISDTITYSFLITPTAIEKGMIVADPLPPEVEYAGNLTYTWGYAWYDSGDNTVYWTPPVLPLLSEPEAAPAAPVFEGPLPEGAVEVLDPAEPTGEACEAIAFSPEDIGIDAVLWDNGPLITHPGACSGQDASRLQNTSLGMNTLGFGHQFSLGYSMADDFVVSDPLGWDVEELIFFAYQTGAPNTPSPITGVYYQIWNGPPNVVGSSVIWGDLVTNRLVSSTWINAQRDSESTNCANNRYLFANTASAGFHLPPGTYWVQWTTAGNPSYSGPWAPPITLLGQTTTGNALQYVTSWGPALDSGTGTQQGMPFVILGTVPSIQVSFDVTIPFQGDCDFEIYNEANASCGYYQQYYGALTQVNGYGEAVITAGDLHAYHVPDMTSTQTFNIANVGICPLDYYIWEMPGIIQHKHASNINHRPPFAAPPPGAEKIALSAPGTGGPAAPAENPDALLWNQPTNNMNAIIDQYFPDFGAGVFSGDDFSASDAWAITRIYMDGIGWYPGSLQYAESLNWYIYADNSGQPAGYPGGGGEIWSYSAAPGDPGVILGGWNSDEYTLDLLAATGAPLILPPGNYWLVSYPSLTYTLYSQWFWDTSSASSGSNAMLIDPTDLLGAGWTNWTPWTVIDPSATAAAFRLEGYVYYDIPWLSENPFFGTLLGGENVDINLLYDSTGLTSGEYTGNLDVETSDPANPITTLPVALTVFEPSVFLNKTVGLDWATCQVTDVITVPVGTEVVYCYELINTGDITFTTHDLYDDMLGDLLVGFAYELAPGESVVVSATAVINNYTLNTGYYTATTDLGFDATATNAAIVYTYELPDVADLSLTKADEPDPVLVGGLLTYTLTVENLGPDTAANTVLTDTLPAGVTFQSASPGCTETGGVVTCDLGDIASGDSVVVTIVVLAPDTEGVITNHALVSSATSDPDGTNNEASEDTTVQAEIVLEYFIYLPTIHKLAP